MTNGIMMKNVTPSGVKMVKFVTVPKVHAVERRGPARHRRGCHASALVMAAGD